MNMYTKVSMTFFILFLAGTIIYYLAKKKKINLSADSIKITFVLIGAMYLTYVFGLFFQEPEGHLFGTADGWLGFLGALFSCLVGYVGVVLTINFQTARFRYEDSLREEEKKKENKRREEERREELAIRYKPLMTIVFSNRDKEPLVLEDHDSNSKSSRKEYVYTVWIDITNIGRGEALNFYAEAILDRTNIHTLYFSNLEENDSIILTENAIPYKMVIGGRDFERLNFWVDFKLHYEDLVGFSYVQTQAYQLDLRAKKVKIIEKIIGPIEREQKEDKS